MKIHDDDSNEDAADDAACWLDYDESERERGPEKYEIIMRYSQLI